MKILIVDDSRVARNSLKKALAGLSDITFSEADDGTTALEAIAQDPPDILFTDWYMGEMDGLELIQKVKQTHAHIKICMFTSETNEERKNLALQEGADYLVNKPFKVNEVVKALEYLIG